MEVVFINTGNVFDMLDKKGIVEYLSRKNLEEYIPLFKKRIEHYTKFSKKEYFQDYIDLIGQRQIFLKYYWVSIREKEDNLIDMVKKKHPYITDLFDSQKNRGFLNFPNVKNFAYIFKQKMELNIIEDKFFRTNISISPVRLYEKLCNFSFLRDGEIYEMEKKFVYNTWRNHTTYFVNTCYIEEDGRIVSNDRTEWLKKELIRQFRLEYPFIYKYYRIEGVTECNESKHGLIYGLTHRTTVPSFLNSIKEGWLDPFYSQTRFMVPWEYGIYMKLLTENSGVETHDMIILVFSAALLDDLDYYGNDDEDFGVRGESSFYKGLCYKCPKYLKKYSSAERAVIYGQLGEIVFREPISLERYLEKIVVPDTKYMDDKKIPKYYRDMMVTETEPNIYYRKNCSGKLSEPENIIKKYMKKYPKNIPKEYIPKEDLVEIVKRNDVKLIETGNNRIKEIPFTIKKG